MKKTISIKDSDTFQKVMNKGEWYGGDLISAFIMTNSQDHNEIGLAIGKKVGKAFKRNKIKRFIKESYRLLEKDLKIGYNIVFVWKQKANFEDASFENIEKDVQKMLTKAGLIK